MTTITTDFQYRAQNNESPKYLFTDQSDRTPGRSSGDCSAFQNSKDLKTSKKSSSGQSIELYRDPVSKDEKGSFMSCNTYSRVASEVNHQLNHFQWKAAIKAEQGACDLTTQQRDGLIQKIVTRALMAPTRPPTQTVDFYDYAERTGDPEGKQNLIERIVNKWPGVSWAKEGEAATLARLDGLSKTKRFIQYQALVDAEILKENPYPSPLQKYGIQRKKGNVQSLCSVSKEKGSKHLPPHLRG